MDESLPTGVWPVALTPFTADDRVDLAGLDALVDWYLDAGVAGIFAVCQSSEMTELGEDEKLAIVERMLRRVDGRVPIVAAGMDQAEPSQRVAYARRLHAAGVAAVVLVTNRFAAADEDDAVWWERVSAFLDASGDLPLGLYECPRPYPRWLGAETVARCAATGRFRFMKETSCDLDALAAKLRAAAASPLRIYPAHGPSVLAGLELGAAGCCNIAANVLGDCYAWLCRHRTAQPELARDLHAFLTVADPLVRLGYPASAKRWLARCGLPLGDRCRTPVDPVRVDDEPLLHAALDRQLVAWRQRLAQATASHPPSVRAAR